MSMKTKAVVLVTSFAVLLFVVVGSLGGVHASPTTALTVNCRLQ